MFEIDGSYGEGGGQVLRSALSLSLLTGKEIKIGKIRAGRSKPGLRPQHLKAVEAAAAVGAARIEGASTGSTSLVFVPGRIHPGSFRFDIGTAGSTSLVLQTVLLPLALAVESSRLVISGGTHVPWSPCFHYLERNWLASLRKVGIQASATMERTGFYPRGGGIILARVQPVRHIAPLTLLERGRLRRLDCLSFVTLLDEGIARRQMAQVERRLEERFPRMHKEILSLPGPGPGTLLLLLAEFEQGRFCGYALGERGKPAERVADEAVDAFEEFLASGAAVDPYLADQLILPMSFAEGVSQIRTPRVTPHLVTNVWVVKQFLPVDIRIEGEEGGPGTVRIEGLARPGEK